MAEEGIEAQQVQAPSAPEVNNPIQELSPERIAALDSGIADLIDSFEMWQMEGIPLSFTPASMIEGDPEVRFANLPPAEQTHIRTSLFAAVRFNPQEKDVVSTYQIEAPDDAPWKGTATVEVCKTGLYEERGAFLHIIHYPDGTQEPIIADSELRI